MYRCVGSRIQLISKWIVALALLTSILQLNLHQISLHHNDLTERQSSVHEAIHHNSQRRQLNTNTTIPSVQDPPCSDILLHRTPQERCTHALHCDGEYLMQTLLPFAFCLDDINSSPLKSYPTLRYFFPLLFPLLLTTSTILLFRLLASTAENYFSPALEMISAEFQIPPPLAGVTLLALGNGSPDVSAVVNAIKANPAEGIPLSLGELTGGGMFVQCIVVGRIVSIGRKGEDGVKCRAELIRDMTMYAVSSGYVFWMCARETIYYRHVVYMFVLYSGYVAAVVAFEVRRYYRNNSFSESDESIVEDVEKKCKTSLLCDPEELDYTENIAPTPSQDEEDHATLELSQTRQQSDAAAPQSRIQDPPGSKHSARIICVIKIQQDRLRRERMLKRFRPDLISRRMSKPEDCVGLANVDLQQRMWSMGLFTEALHELREHLQQVLFNDGCGNNELSKAERILAILESPFVILRKFVTPLPCEGDYNRSMVAFSLAFSPLWIGAYLAFKLESFDPFHVDSNGIQVPLIFWPCCLSVVCGCIVLRYAPKDTVMPLRYTVPIALYGFVIAATWIDVISDQLVNLLEFVGVVLRIPSPIMGLTVLAWGNSVGDYSTNSALAQKGFADMSMAACFAGPSFNLLIGLGSGLLSQKESLMSEDGLHFISLVPSVKMGFLFLISNCILAIGVGIYHNGILPKWYSYVLGSMYLCYMTMNAQLLLL